VRIGADASYLRWGASGLARYLQGLLPALADQLGPADDLVAYTNAWPGRPPLGVGPAARERAIRLPRSTLWNQVAVPAAAWRDGCDVYLGGANVVPARAAQPRVVVMHDCKAFRHPEAETPARGRYWRRWQRASAGASATVIAVSRWAADECRRWLAVPDERLRVVYQGIAPVFGPDGPARTPPGVDGPFVLQVGAFEPHKGAALALAAVRRLEGVTLVRCGPRSVPGRGDRVVDLGLVDDAELAGLYRAAAAVVVTSEHEGFGLPVVEAMASGTPVVAVRACALPEAGGDAAVWAAPGDAAEVAAGLARLLTEPAVHAHHRAAGLRQAARFEWPSAAAQVLAALREAAG
jgi:glycosyltransferase involved in cell wall biosynthesis